MTSPLSLLGMLGGADPAPEPAPPQDPAAFAAALLAALQVLQPPAVTQPAPLPTVTADVADDGAGTSESGDADAEASSGAAGGTAADQGQVVPAGNAIVVELAGDMEPGLPDSVATPDAPATSDGLPPADASKHGTTAIPPTTTEAKGTARAGSSGAGDSAPESTAADVPAELGTGAETATRPTSGATPVERSLETKPRHGARTAKRNAGPAFMPAEMERTVAMPERKLAARKCEPSPVEAAPRIGRDAPPVAAPAAIATAAPRPVGPEVEARLPGPAVEADAEDEKPAVGGAPRQLDAGAPAGTTVPVVPVLPPPVVAPRTAVPARAADERPSRESTPAPVPPQVDAAGNPEPWTQAGNARLASQLAELMQGLDVTEFRMTLARRNGPPAAPREGAMADLTDAVPAGETAKPVGVMALSAPEAAV
ncbi:MAG TPA: hypothetical protein VG692_20310, partial [Gemmatimonadales bacterium]|nr:hypothetical protein [Gemmatimonadales bacterium]